MLTDTPNPTAVSRDLRVSLTAMPTDVLWRYFTCMQSRYHQLRADGSRRASRELRLLLNDLDACLGELGENRGYPVHEI